MVFNLFKKKKVITHKYSTRGSKNTRKLTQIAGGSSFGITLPLNTLREFGWKKGDKLHLTIDRKIQTIKIKKTI